MNPYKQFADGLVGENGDATQESGQPCDVAGNAWWVRYGKADSLQAYALDMDPTDECANCGCSLSRHSDAERASCVAMLSEVR